MSVKSYNISPESPFPLSIQDQGRHQGTLSQNVDFSSLFSAQVTQYKVIAYIQEITRFQSEPIWITGLEVIAFLIFH